MSDQSLTVSELLSRSQQAIVAEFPSPVWVRGEITGMRRTNRGAAFFRLADPAVADTALDIAARGRVMMNVDQTLGDAGLGSLRDGVEVRIRGTVGVEARSSVVRLSLLEVDPAFTAGRLALDRGKVIARMTADGSLMANGNLPLPMVPLHIGLVTSRGSAAHADFIDQLERSPYRFHVQTAHTSVQGEAAADQIATAVARLLDEPVDMIAIVRGGGSALDLSVFDTEVVARAIASSPIPVITGVGHDTDRSVADDAAALSEKTPSAVGEWLVSRVKDYADRVDIARNAIRAEATSALRRHHQILRNAVSDIAGSASALRRQEDALDALRFDIAHSSREMLDRRRTVLTSLGEWFSAIELEPTLRRGFAIVTQGSTVVRSIGQISPGDLLDVRFSDGTVTVRVEES